MIELKNVKKVYKSKKGPSTTVLNNINLKIGNKGMLFIIGKSGCGKSTLLNLLGGLDSLTDGSITIDGKNISKFTKKEYDSYRNTYIGFIFQEFNVLEQYSVFENVELALKLQNQTYTHEQINDLLAKVGISDLVNRKINELSGGQKQRVAITRALIKNPRIILADEPTGNLDKSTTKQIFEILKKISKDQLVIVVSHDMDAAKKYADRIIELEDGNIISDSKKVENDDIKSNSLKLKKSKLPFSYALKMAITGLKTKLLKLFMTILLTAMSLVFMGITVNCVLFDKTMLVVNTMKDNNNYVYDINNSKYDSQGITDMLSLSEEDVENIKKITNSKINLVYNLYDNSSILGFEFGENSGSSQYYITRYPEYNQFVELEDSRLLGKIIGKKPSNANEIVVHKYFAEYMMEFGVMTVDDTLYFPKDYNEIISSKKELKLGQNKMIITGIIDDNDSLFLEVKESGRFASDELKNYFGNSYASKGAYIYVKDFVENAILGSNKESILDYASIFIDSTIGNTYTSENINTLNKEISIITENGISTIFSLETDEIIISLETLKLFDSTFDTKFNDYLASRGNMIYNEALNDFIILYLKNDINSLKLKLLFRVNNEKYNEGINIKVVGISLDQYNYISYQHIENYEPKLKEISSIKIFDDDINNLTNTFNKLLYRDAYDIEPGTHYNYIIDVDGSGDLGEIMVTYKDLAIYILIVSLVFVLFTFLLFSNFIATSISYCKKEIGILRALGTTGVDVIKIFGYESLIIGIVSWFISIIGWFLICSALNKTLFIDVYYTLNGIITHPVVPLIMFVYTIAIALLITYVSISRINNIKPIDAINNK